MNFPQQNPLDDWDDAYLKVEYYLRALRVYNRVLLSRLVNRILEKAQDAVNQNPSLTPQKAAAEETDRVVSSWFREVLDNPQETSERISARGRLGLLLAQMPERYQPYFLADKPWPEAFVKAMRKSYLNASPDAKVTVMQPRPLELGGIPSAADATFRTLERFPIVKTIVVWFFYGIGLVLLFLITR